MKIHLLCLFLFVSCATKVKDSKNDILRFPFESDIRVPTKDKSFSSFKLGGFSGLECISSDMQNGRFLVLMPMDRGPNGDPMKDKASAQDLRPFLEPAYVPSLVVMEGSSFAKTLTVKNIIPLKTKNIMMSGLPNSKTVDETPLSKGGARLGYDSSGLDLEAVQVDSKGGVWAIEEYGPSLLKMNFAGEVLKRFIPEGSKQRSGIALLPRELLERRNNRGFEALAVAHNKALLFLQSPYKK